MREFFERERGVVLVTCTRALYSCCGKGFVPREGYEQIYRGRVNKTTESDVMLIALGIGTISYTVLIAYEDILDYQRA